MRSAALTSGVAADDGPATRNSARGLGRVQPAQIRAGAAHELPAAVATGAGVDRHAGDSERLQVPAGGALGHLELGRDLGRGHLAALLEQQEDGHEAVGTHDPILAWNPVTL